MDSLLTAQILSAFTNGQNIKDIDQGTLEYQRAKKLEGCFTGGVMAIGLVPKPMFISLSKYLWDVCHHRHVVAAVGPPVKSLTFTVLRRGHDMQAIVIVPLNWDEMVEKDPVMQLGAVIFAGSQAVDYYNDRFTSETPNRIQLRAQNYEAEYLRVVQPAVTLNPYQERVLSEHPLFDTTLLYDLRPVVGVPS